MSTLVVPVTLWGPKPPSHLITAILLTQSRSCLLTASNSGQLCLWSVVYRRDVEEVVRGGVGNSVNSSSNGEGEEKKHSERDGDVGNGGGGGGGGVLSFHCRTLAAQRLKSQRELGEDGTGRESTGTSKGGREDDIIDVVPKMMLFGHQTAVTCIVECVFVQETTHTAVACSASEDGVICVWDLKDGRCLQSTTLFPESPKHMRALKDQRHIVCCGHYPAVQILDVATLTVVHTFRSQVQPDWLSAMCTCAIPSEDDPSRETEALLAVTINGTLKLWSLEFMEENHYEQPSMPPLRVFCLEGCENPVRLEVNPFNSSVILIVCQGRWKLHTGSDFQVLFDVPCPFSLGWTGGTFVSEFEVLVWGVDGNGYLYELPADAPYMKELPRLTLTVRQNNTEDNKNGSEAGGEKSNNSENSVARLVKVFTCDDIASPCGIESQHISVLNGSFPAMSVLIGGVGQNGSGRVVNSGIMKEESSYLFCGDGSAKICAWNLKGDSGVQSKNNLKGGSTCTVTPVIERSLPAFWASSFGSSSQSSSSNSPPLNDTRMGGNGVGGREDSLTATVFVNENVVVQGYESGIIEVSKFVFSSSSSSTGDVRGNGPSRSVLAGGLLGIPNGSSSPLLSGNNNASSSSSAVNSHSLGYGIKTTSRKYLGTLPCETRILTGHSGRITCLFHPAREYSGDVNGSRESNGGAGGTPEPDILVSGSCDFTVKVWNLDTGELMRTFSNHSGEITTIIQPPPYNAKLKDLFCSVSEDHCIGIYSFEQLRCIHLVGGHAFPVRTVRWRVSDEFLVVGCTDGTVYVWQLDTGVLDRVVNGALGEDILKNCDQSNVYDEDHKSISPLNSIELNSVKMSASEAPLQVISLNVRRLVSDLRLASDKNDSFVSKLMLSYCLAWGIDPEVDRICIKELGVSPPPGHVSYGIKGFKGTLSVMLPANHNNVERWLYSSHITAVHIISLVSVLLGMLAEKGEPYHKGSSTIIDFYLGGGLAKHVPYFVAPSILTLARYWQDSLLDVREACKWLLYDTVENFSPERRLPLIKKCLQALIDAKKRNRLVPTIPGVHNQQQQIASLPLVPVVVLGIFGSRYSADFDDEVVSITVANIQSIVQMGCPDELSTKFSYRMAVVELLGTGFACWEPHLDTVAIVRNLLLRLAEVSTALNNSSVRSSSSVLVLYSRVYQNTLLTIALMRPKVFVNTLSQEMYASTNDVHKRVTGLRIIRALVRADPKVLLPFVPKLVEITIKSLDPHVPHLRDGCMRVSTEGLQEMVKQFGIVTFHSSTQRVAVGTGEGLIVIYDLKTGSRWQVLEGHKSPITAVTFSFDGKYLASFALSDLLVLNWNINSTFLGMLGSSPKCSRTFTVPFHGVLDNTEAIELVTLVWVSARKLSLIICGKEYNFAW
eukprot:Nk52_evm10s269 gene=Nk52_evmTU10s269